MEPDLLEKCQRLLEEQKTLEESEQVKGELEMLAHRGVASFDQLKLALPTLEPPEFFTALKLLTLFGRRKAVPVLLDLLPHNEAECRYEVAKQLTTLGGALAIKGCMDLLKSD